MCLCYYCGIIPISANASYIPASVKFLTTFLLYSFLLRDRTTSSGIYSSIFWISPFEITSPFSLSSISIILLGTGPIAPKAILTSSKCVFDASALTRNAELAVEIHRERLSPTFLNAHPYSFKTGQVIEEITSPFSSKFFPTPVINSVIGVSFSHILLSFEVIV